MAVSLGSVETLVTRPALDTHLHLGAAGRKARAGPPERGLSLALPSVGQSLQDVYVWLRRAAEHMAFYLSSAQTDMLGC